MLYIAYAVLWLLRFALGACVFSFLGVVVWRLPRRESVVKGRSHCPACGRTLSAAELIPCLSYLLQGGKCRGCGAKIPARDFWIEVLGGLCSCACAYAFGGESAQAALAFVVPGGFGGGDIKLMFGAGFFLGAKLTVVAAFIGILLGGGFGALLLAQKKANRKSQFAFGPFLCIGIAIAMFFGETIADWYMGLL